MLSIKVQQLNFLSKPERSLWKGEEKKGEKKKAKSCLFILVEKINCNCYCNFLR